MANNYIKFSEAPEATDAQMTDAGLVGVSIVDANSSTGFSTRKSPLSKLANYVLNKFNTLSLGGATQTVKSAIDSIADGFGHLIEYVIGDTDMGTTADTITGAIAEHESDITSLNSSLSLVGDVLSPISSYINSSTTALTFYKTGKIGILYYNIGWTSMVSGTELDVCSIASIALPRMKYNFTECNQAGEPFLFQVYADGRVTAIAANHTNSMMVRGTLVFPVL